MNARFQRRLLSDAARLARRGGELQSAAAAFLAAFVPPVPSGGGRADAVADVGTAEAGPDGAFVQERFGAGTKARDYKLFIPPGPLAQRRPLVLMLHGCTQDPDDFAAGTAMNEAAREEGLFVLYPAQCDRAHPHRCWNWFRRSHQARGRGEPALLAAMVRAVMAQHAIDPARVYVAGLSAGGAMAAILGEAYPELFAAVGVHSGLRPGAARDVASAMRAMKQGAPESATPWRPARPTIVVHGEADRTVHPRNADLLVPLEAGPGITVATETVSTSGRHAYTRRVHRNAQGAVVAEHWLVHGATHAWSGGRRPASHTDPQGPDATRAMLAFFERHVLAPGGRMRVK